MRSRTLLEGIYFALCFVIPGIIIEGYTYVFGSSMNSFVLAIVFGFIGGLGMILGVHYFSYYTQARQEN